MTRPIEVRFLGIAGFRKRPWVFITFVTLVI